MATKPLVSNPVADLPENWTNNQIVAPSGTSVGLTQQHGYNYLMEKVNEALEDLGDVNDAFPDLLAQENESTVKALSGDVVSFQDGANGIPVKSFVGSILPQQNLNGYEYPWPAGGGKNKFNGADVSTTSTANWSITWASTTNILTIVRNGSGSAGTPAVTLNGLSAGTYVISWSDKAALQVRVNVGDTSVSTNASSGLSFTVNEGEAVQILFYLPSAGTGTVTNFQLESGSTPTSYAPYSNICPISGWSEAEIFRTGKNLWNQARLLEATGVTYDSATGYYSGTSSNINQKFSQSTDGLLGNNLNWPQVAVSFYGYSMRTDSQSAFSIVFLYTDGTTSSVMLNGGQTPRLYTGVSTAGKTVQKIYTSYASGSTVYLKDMQVEFGSSVSAYEAYDGQTILLSFGSTVYAGTITALGGGRWQIQPTHKYDALDSHNWTYGSNSRAYTTGVSDMKQESLRSEYIYCSCYGANVGGGAYAMNTIYNGTSGYVYVVDGRTDDGDTLKELLAGQYMVYPLATLPDPIIVSGEDLATLLGSNTVWLSTGSITDLKYLSDGLVSASQLAPSAFTGEIFIGTYGETTYAEFKDALANGKMVFCVKDGAYYSYSYEFNSQVLYFTGIKDLATAWYVRVDSSNTWASGSQNNQRQHSELTVTLYAADWSSGSQTVAASGVVSGVLVIVSPVPSDAEAYANAGVLCTAQGSNTLTFTCVSTPADDIDVNVAIFA